MLKMFIIVYKKYKFIPKISYLSKFIRKVVLKNMTKNTFFLLWIFEHYENISHKFICHCKLQMHTSKII